MTLDKRAWCAPISLRLSKETVDSSSDASSSLMKLVKSSPVDKGTTTSFYCLKSGQLKTRIIETAQDKSFHLKRVETAEEHSVFGLDKESKDLRNLIKKRLFEESFSENLLKLQVNNWILEEKEKVPRYFSQEFQDLLAAGLKIPLRPYFKPFSAQFFLGICEERGHFSLVEGRHVEAFTGKARKSAFIFTKAFQGDERMSAYLEDQKKEKREEITTFLGKSKEFLWPVSLLRNFLHWKWQIQKL